jgi:bifunctional ADP-heptose synthase (sugar kinase/adenylyltransferase)
MEFVRAVVIFNEDTPYELISLIQPDVLVKGGDYELDQIIGKDIIDAKNGLVKTIDLIPGYSTTSILNRL